MITRRKRRWEVAWMMMARGRKMRRSWSWRRRRKGRRMRGKGSNIRMMIIRVNP